MKKNVIKFKIGQKVKILALNQEGVIKNLTVCPKFTEYQVTVNGAKLSFNENELAES